MTTNTGASQGERVSTLSPRTTCESCKWWHDFGAKDRAHFNDSPRDWDVGECRAHPPTRNSDWVRTARVDWCGEHTPHREERR